jgi:hypothetical protein
MAAPLPCCDEPRLDWGSNDDVRRLADSRSPRRTCWQATRVLLCRTARSLLLVPGLDSKFDTKLPVHGPWYLPRPAHRSLIGALAWLLQ